jgi:hypothetical protein
LFNYTFGIAFSPAFDGAINLDDVIVPDITNPYIGLSIVSDVDGKTLIVEDILRYNGHGRFTCNLSDEISFNTCLDVYYNETFLAWRAKRYVPERYRDEDGVLKGL